jgi:hypothetical protein
MPTATKRNWTQAARQGRWGRHPSSPWDSRSSAAPSRARRRYRRLPPPPEFASGCGSPKPQSPCLARPRVSVVMLAQPWKQRRGILADQAEVMQRNGSVPHASIRQCPLRGRALRAGPARGQYRLEGSPVARKMSGGGRQLGGVEVRPALVRRHMEPSGNGVVQPL